MCGTSNWRFRASTGVYVWKVVVARGEERGDEFGVPESVPGRSAMTHVDVPF
jgi:hypothetical protein